jgi:allophanate hydrolase
VVEQGRQYSAVDLFADQHRLAALQRQLAPVWDEIDALLCPTVPDLPTLAAVEADPIGANAALGRWTNGVNLLDLCGVTVPAGRRADGLPGSVTVLGPTGGDTLVAELAARVTAPRVALAVVGAHLSGLPLNHQLTERHAYLEQTTRTAPAYRLHALATEPPKPGLVRVAEGGAAIEAEVWSLDVESFGSFVAEVPPPLAIGTVELADGTQVNGFVCEPLAVADAPDISQHGGWRAWLAGR